jgi:hypothetical protein
MAQLELRNYAASRGVTIKPRRGEYASRMALRQRNAASRDVPIKP